MVNNHFNTVDSMLRTILAISVVDRRYKNGAKYLRHVYCSENKQIMNEEFTDTQKEQIKLVSGEIYFQNEYYLAFATLKNCDPLSLEKMIPYVTRLESQSANQPLGNFSIPERLVRQWFVLTAQKSSK